MARVFDRQRAIELRKKGRTYGEIRRYLKISKSTLSDWLSNYPLTNEQIILLEKNRKKNKDLAVEKVRIVKQKKREARLAHLYKKERRHWLPLTQRELALAGIFLYWGEGRKGLAGQLSLNNTDPQVLKFTLYWLINALKVPRDKIRGYIHLYSDMDVNQEMKFWSQELKLPLSRFCKPYIKKSKKSNLDHKGFGHGTCGIVVNNVRLKEKIMMAIKSIADHYSKKI